MAEDIAEGLSSGIKGNMYIVVWLYKVMKTFVSTGCVNPVTSTGHTSIDIGVNANLELVDKFCYFDDMLSVDRDADAAVETRIWIGWNELVPLVTDKDMSLIERDIVQQLCVK